MEEAIEIRCSLVDRRVGLCHWVFDEFHDLGSDGTEGWSAPEPRTGGSLLVCSGSPYQTEGLCRSLAKMPVGTGSRLDAIFANVSAASLSCLSIWLRSRPSNLSSNCQTL